MLNSSNFVIVLILVFYILWFIQLESICENTVTMERKQNQFTNFVPMLRSGEWSHIGDRPHMEDTHVCISDLAGKFGNKLLSEKDAVSFYGVNSYPIMLLVRCTG